MTEMMSTSVPAWDTADRMRKAARQADISVTALASYMGVSRNTVGNWINGHVTPGTQTLRLWAMRCGVSYDWLRGVDTHEPEPTASRLPRLGSNQLPAGIGPTRSRSTFPLPIAA